jgi:hypothetical protein
VLNEKNKFFELFNFVQEELLAFNFVSWAISFDALRP